MLYESLESVCGLVGKSLTDADDLQCSRCFPKNEQYTLADQIKRAVASVPANIVVGHSRNAQILPAAEL